MFIINEDNSIYVNRGDILFFSVSAKEEDGTPHHFIPGDVLRIKVYGKKDAETVVLEKDFPVVENAEEVEIYLDKEDTKIGEVISKPKDYWYEVELNPMSAPQTIIGYGEDGACLFRLFPEGADVDEPYEPAPEDFPVVDEAFDLTSPRPVANQVIAAEIERIKRDTAKDYVTPQMFGAVGDGVADDTEAIQAAIDNSASGLVYFPDAVYKHGTITVQDKENFVIDGNFARHILSGADTTAFLLTGRLRNVTIKNCVIEGDGNADSGQIGIGSPSGVDMENIRILHNEVSGCAVGISVNADFAGHIFDVTVENNTVIGSVGTDPGQGYGIHASDGMDEPANVKIINNTVKGCARHSIYIARGRGYIVENNYIVDHRATIYNDNPRAAIQLARCKDITVTGNFLENCYDAHIMVVGEGENDGTYPQESYPAKNITIARNQLKGPTNISALWIGYFADNTIPENITVEGNTFLEAKAEIRMGINVAIRNNQFTGTGGWSIIVNALPNEDNTNSNDLYFIENNTAINPDGYMIRLQPTFCASSVKTAFKNNRGSYIAAFNSAENITNANITLVGESDGLSMIVPLMREWYGNSQTIQRQSGAVSVDLFDDTLDNSKTVNLTGFDSVPTLVITPCNTSTDSTNATYKDNQIQHVRYLVTELTKDSFTIRAVKDADSGNTVAQFNWLAISL